MHIYDVVVVLIVANYHKDCIFR